MWRITKASGMQKGKKDIDMSTVEIDPIIHTFVNRLSDLFFAMTRYISNDKEIRLKDMREWD